MRTRPPCWPRRTPPSASRGSRPRSTSRARGTPRWPAASCWPPGRKATRTIVGGGVATPPGGSGFTEIAGIAVAEGHRRRGLAAALTAELTRRALAAGVRTLFLNPGDDGAARVYERAGFASAGRMLHARLE